MVWRKAFAPKKQLFPEVKVLMPAEQSTQPKKAALALSGVRVLALEVSVAGPHATRILGDMGAEVIKLEKLGTGDLIRQLGFRCPRPFLRLRLAQRQQAKFCSGREEESRPRSAPPPCRTSGCCSGKLCAGRGRSHGSGRGGTVCAQSKADLLFRLRLRAGWPYRDVKAYDLLIQGEAGIIATTGYPDKPAKVGVPIIDLASSMYATAGILLALYQREKTGRGQVIDISMFESARFLARIFSRTTTGTREKNLPGSGCATITYPYGPYLASDGEYVSLAVATASDWEDLLQASDRAHGASGRRAVQDAGSAAEESRGPGRAHRKDFSGAPARGMARRLKESRLPYGEVKGIGQVLAHPQVIARKMVREMESPVGPVPVVASPLRLSDSPARYDPIPALGEDTDPSSASLVTATRRSKISAATRSSDDRSWRRFHPKIC